MGNKAQKRLDSKYNELERARKAEEAGRQLPIGGKATKMGESLWGDRKAASAAYDHVQNMRESRREVAEERFKQEVNDRSAYNYDRSPTNKKGGRYAK
jgi:hypothetical protein